MNVMEDKKLNEKESLELITQMIQNTRQSLDAGSGNMFLLWGYVSAVITIIVMLGVYLLKNDAWLWGFFGIPVLGYLLTFLLMRRQQEKPVKMYGDTILNELWKLIGSCCCAIVIICLIESTMFVILPLTGMILSIGSILTGVIIRYNKFTLAGVGFAMSIVMLSNALQNKHAAVLVGFIIVVIFSLIIPGHILNSKARKMQRKER